MERACERSCETAIGVNSSNNAHFIGSLNCFIGRACRPGGLHHSSCRRWFNVVEPERTDLFHGAVVCEPWLSVDVRQAVAPHHPAGWADYVPARRGNQRIDRAHRRKPGPEHELLRRETEFAECDLCRAEFTKTPRQAD